MCSNGLFQFRWKDISLAHVIIIIKSEVSTFVIIFIRSWAPAMFVSSYFVTNCLYIPGKPGFCFIIIMQFMMSAKSWIRFGLQIVLVCLYIPPSHYHHCANLFEDIEMSVRYILSSAWVRLNIFSQLSIIKYMGLCVFSLPTSLVMIERIYTCFIIIIIKSDVWTIIHYLWLCHETMVCTVCLSISS